jgi:N-formylglutamate amidohydrolase
MTRRGTVLLVLAALVATSSRAYEASSMIEARAGTLPLLLTVPHDGTEPLGTIAARSNGQTVRDMNARLLAERIATALEKKTGKRPYLVIAKFSRKYLDVNRPEAEAMESRDALPAYRAYHDQVKAYVAEMKAKYPKEALLVDVHGQGAAANTTFLGTRGGLTSKRSLDRIGSQPLREDARYSGGYTVFEYGSHKAGGIDAIQLEFGLSQRNSAAFAEEVADSLVKLMDQNFSSLRR